MEWWEAFILGLVQGLTEFIPVSSSGHLVLGQYFLGIELTQNVTFEVFVHFGTILSVLTLYGRRAVRILGSTLNALLHPGSLGERYRADEPVRFGLLILVTMVPTGIVYVLLGDWLKSAFASPRLASAMLLVTGVLLILTVLCPDPEGSLNSLKAFLIGVAQSAALIPGISRSGATICVALYQKVTPKKAADFSFLMLLPVVMGATLIDALDILQHGTRIGLKPLLIGTTVAYTSGVVAIWIVLDVVQSGRLQYFAYYCFVLGGAGLIFI